MIRGQGMPSERHHEPGNLYIQFDVEFPESVDPMTLDQKNTLKKILGLPPVDTLKASKDPDAMEDDGPLEVDAFTDPIPAGVDEDEQMLEEPDAQGARGATMEDDDDDMHPGAERVQCANQ